MRERDGEQDEHRAARLRDRASLSVAVTREQRFELLFSGRFMAAYFLPPIAERAARSQRHFGQDCAVLSSVPLWTPCRTRTTRGH